MTELRIGWMRFWGTFSQPWRVVIGFLCASFVARLVVALLHALLLALWRA